MKHPQIDRQVFCTERITMPESAAFVLRIECERPKLKDYEGVKAYVDWKIEWMKQHMPDIPAHEQD